MTEPAFINEPTCTLCPLYQSATHPFTPSRTLSRTNVEGPTLLFIGEAPGWNEDQQRACWIGQSGQLLTKFIEAAELSTYCPAIHLSNSCRCRPAQNTNPSPGQISKCRTYLAQDISSILSAPYLTELILVLCGATAVRSVLGSKSLQASFTTQLQPLPDSSPIGKFLNPDQRSKIRVLSTYHPAMLLSGRKPALIHAVSAHFDMLKNYVQTGTLPFDLVLQCEHGAPVPPSLPSSQFPWGSDKLVSVDIETYGILSGKSQTVFHPAKSLSVDKIRPENMIATVSFCTSDNRAYSYEWQKHLPLIRGWFRLIAREKALLIGQNIKFDLQYIRFCDHDPSLAYLLRPGQIRLDDTIILSFLQYEQRPERGLKELSALFGIHSYSDIPLDGHGGTATSPSDPTLLRYNCTDAAVTIKLYLHLLKMIRERFGAQTPKLTSQCLDFRNQLIWCCLNLETNGFRMNLKDLAQYDLELTTQIEEMEAQAVFSHDLLLSGKGSDKSCRNYMLNARDRLSTLGYHPDVAYTEKRGDICVNNENINRLIAIDPNDAGLKLLSLYHEKSKIKNTYTSKLLSGPAVGCDSFGMCYPSWYPVPRADNKDSSGTNGGTIQGRFSVKKPSLPTFPPPIKKMIISRFPGGYLDCYDLSQIELRIAALISGDPIMISEYQNSIDRHTETAKLVFPFADPTSPDYRSTYRQAGKTLNFLILYRGGASKFQETVMKDVGLHLTYETCEAAIHAFYAKYLGFKKWQDNLLETVRKRGFLELPTGWSRSFGSGQSAIDSYINEICNFPIQTIAAQLLQSAEYAILQELTERRMFTCIPFQIYDALYLDVYPTEQDHLDPIISKHLSRPPLLPFLEQHYGNSVPILFEKG